MEHHAQSIDDALISGLSYKMKAGASYVTNRRSVSYFSSGGNSYSSSGVRVLKFNLTGDQWLDPSTLRVAFTLNNDTTVVENKLIQPLSWNPAIFFRRARVIAGGQILEDIDDFNRLSMMLTCLKPRDEQLMIASEGFGSFDDKGPGVTEAGGGVQDDRKNYRTDDYDIGGYVEPAGSRRVLFKPMFGLLHQEKLLPLRYCPIQIELELVNQSADAVHVGTSLNGQTSDSDKWSMSDAQIKCDLVTLDNSLENEYASHLLSGKSLPINFSTWNHTNQSTGNDKNFSAHVNRSKEGTSSSARVPSAAEFFKLSRIRECSTIGLPITDKTSTPSHASTSNVAIARAPGAVQSPHKTQRSGQGRERTPPNHAPRAYGTSLS